MALRRTGGQRASSRDDRTGGQRSPSRDDRTGGQRSPSLDDRTGGQRSPSLDDLTEAELDQRCLDAALRFLAQRPRSEQEIRRRLTEKGWAVERLDRVLAQLRALGLVDDRAFADYWLENRALFKPRGNRALRAELFQKGVAREVVEQAVDPERDEADDAYRAAGRRAATLSILDEPAFRQRLGQFLLRRGFGWDTIEPAVDRLWDERVAAGPRAISSLPAAR